jgi:hypothetical protein
MILPKYRMRSQLKLFFGSINIMKAQKIFSLVAEPIAYYGKIREQESESGTLINPSSRKKK